MPRKELKDIRKQYTRDTLTPSGINKNPFKQYSKWFEAVLSSNFFVHPNAMTLATASAKGKPSARIVLLKGYDEKGFVFYTNYNSRKGKELEVNPYASLLFYWDKLEKQVRVEGKVSKISRKESEAYFNTRPLNSRLGAWASNQSSVISGRGEIMSRFRKYTELYKDNVPLPGFWGGYRLVPDMFEFWQGGVNRLHDRIRYKKTGSGWKIEWLAP